MNEYDLLKAVGETDAELVEAASGAGRARRKAWLIPAAAAALALTVGIFLAVRGGETGAKKQEAVSPTAAPTEGTGMETPGWQSSYIGFIKYLNTVYFYSETYEDGRELMGEYLGRIETAVDPGTPMENWPDMSSYEKGDFYAVKGCDPAYIICRVNGKRVSVFINRDYENVVYGRDVIETRFHASELFTSLIYEGTESIFNGYAERYALDPECAPTVLDMLAVLDGGEWFTPDDAEYLRIGNSEQWRLSLSLGKMKLGMTIFEGGFACVHQFPNSWLIRFDAEKIKPFWELLASGEHGTPLESTDSIRALRLEQTYSEPHYGAYFPDDLPVGYGFWEAHILFPVDENTGKALTAKPESIIAEYRGIDDFDMMFSIRVHGFESLEALMKEFEGTEPKFRCDAPIGELTVDTVLEETADNGQIFREVMAYDGNVIITVFSLSLTPEQMVALLHQCFGK